jgi:hypothetical protein
LTRGLVIKKKWGPLYIIMKQVGVYTPKGVSPPARLDTLTDNTKIRIIFETPK